MTHHTINIQRKKAPFSLRPKNKCQQPGADIRAGLYSVSTKSPRSEKMQAFFREAALRSPHSQARTVRSVKSVLSDAQVAGKN